MGPERSYKFVIDNPSCQPVADLDFNQLIKIYNQSVHCFKVLNRNHSRHPSSLHVR